MATKGVKNSDRKTGKAWKKDHGVAVKAMTPEAKARKAERGKKPVGSPRGSNFTMPKISWGWATEVMAERWPNTRRVRGLDAEIERLRGRGSNFPTEIEPNPEAKAAAKNGR